MSTASATNNSIAWPPPPPPPATAPSSSSSSRRGVVIPAINVPLSEMAGLQKQRQTQQRQRIVPPADYAAAAAVDYRERIFSSAAMAATATSSATGSDAGISDLLDDADFPADAGIDRDELVALASQRATPLRLADMYKYGTSRDLSQRLRNAQFLHRELPIRIAQRTVDLLTLPYGLSEATPVKQVAGIYLGYLKSLNEMPAPTTAEEEEAFTDMLHSFVLDRTSVPLWIARGVASWRGGRKTEDLEAERLQEMEDALYRFFTARVGLRFLIEHHVLSSPRESAQKLVNATHMFPEDAAKDKTAEISGCIQSHIDLVKETRKVADHVTNQTKEFFGMCPPIEIVDCVSPEDNPENFTHVPHHLHYMLAELIKNACRATVQQYLNDELHGRVHNSGSGEGDKTKPTTSEDKKLSPIRVIIVKGDEDVTIKIADKGGGIPRSKMVRIWKFGHSCSRDTKESDADFGTDEVTGARIGGFGLPMARIYARYFGGELNLKSVEGYGVGTFQLRRLYFWVTFLVYFLEVNVPFSLFSLFIVPTKRRVFAFATIRR